MKKSKVVPKSIPGRSKARELLQAVRRGGRWRWPGLLNSVGKKLFLLFFVSIVLFVGVSGITSYQISGSVVKSKYAEATQQTIQEATQKLDILFQLYEGLVLQTGTNSQIQDYAKLIFEKKETSAVGIITNLNKVKASLRSSRLTLPGIDSISIIPEDMPDMVFEGGDLPGTVPRAGLNELGWYHAMLESKDKPIWLATNPQGHIYETGHPVIAVGKVFTNYYSNKSVVVVVEVNTKVLEQQLGGIDLGTDSAVTIVGADGNTIYQKEQEKIGTPSPFKVKADGGVAYQDAEDGRSFLTVSSPSERTGWSVLGFVPVSETLKDMDSIFYATLVIALVSGVFALVIGNVAVRMFGKPLVRLRNLMRSGEEGDLSVRASFVSNDEIGQLSDSFNRMMTKINELLSHTRSSANQVLEMSAQLTEVSEKTAHTAQEVSLVMGQIADGTSHLAQEAETSNNMSLTINDKIHDVVEANEEMHRLADKVQSSSEAGVRYLLEVVGHAEQTDQMTREMAEKVESLKASAESIRSIVDLLKNISQQTNVLSLNANIEAARAGAAGKGFAVISNEIRSLADQSKESLKVVEQFTLNIQQEVDGTVGVLTRARPLFARQISAVRESGTIFQQVEQRMGEYKSQLELVSAHIGTLQGIQAKMNETISGVSAVSEEAMASTEEVASLTENQLFVSREVVDIARQLERLSEGLSVNLSKFKVKE
ncbi:methyl-accepting chemotaxis protein [Paenibacillus athensensis]|uniref:Methyl-accepting chemotaxis protein n=1 Tax=Paenibacillus athensensis TaxID=1967502 RepID=A0A4Y8PVN3_9BACL|nr:methyl-accepting chemotaxis protein [Paenibacillus athensensis]MCD1261295.1 methyl-accepting chemotaxis protein [Paenibacillus athensensis]